MCAYMLDHEHVVVHCPASYNVCYLRGVHFSIFELTLYSAYHFTEKYQLDYIRKIGHIHRELQTVSVLCPKLSALNNAMLSMSVHFALSHLAPLMTFIFT